MKKKNKELINPIMNSKVINSKNKGNDNEDDVKSFVKIIIIMAVILLLVYGFTYFINKEKTTNDITINYDKMTFGMLFNRPYDEYYVLIYNSDDSNSSEYSSIISTYNNKSEEEKIKLYFIDLNNKLNKDYYNKDKSNPKATKLSEIQVGDLTLLRIKDKKIVEYKENIDDIKNILNK